MSNPVRVRYDPISLVIHWLTAALVVVAFTLGPEHIGRLMHQGVDPATRWDIVWHESLGVSIFLLTLIRLAWMALRPSAPRFVTAKSMQLVARIMHAILLLLLICLPTTALLALGSEGHPLTLLAGIRVDQVPQLLGSGVAQIADWGEVHKFLGDMLMVLAGLHAAASIFHHFVLKDGVLLAMKPR